MIDTMFLFAVGALGWGLSLSTYSLFARRREWPMGALHVDLPAVPVLIGLLSVTLAVIYAGTRGGDGGGWVILLFGCLLAIFWTGFLRVGSQISILLAPLSAALLLASWLAMPVG